MKLTKDIKPISYVKANTAKVVEQVNTSGPMIITQHGEATAVLMGARDYEKLNEGVALLKILTIGSKDAFKGKRIPIDEGFKDIEKSIVGIDKRIIENGK